MIANVASDPRYLAETMSTLKFAARARLIKTHALTLGLDLALALAPTLTLALALTPNLMPNPS